MEPEHILKMKNAHLSSTAATDPEAEVVTNVPVT